MRTRVYVCANSVCCRDPERTRFHRKNVSIGARIEGRRRCQGRDRRQRDAWRVGAPHVREAGVQNVGVQNVDGMELNERRQWYESACGAGVDLSIIRSLRESLSAVNRFAAGEGLG